MTKEEFRFKFVELMGEALKAEVFSGFVLLWREGKGGGYMADTLNPKEVARRLRGSADSIEMDNNVRSEGAYLIEDGETPLRFKPDEELN